MELFLVLLIGYGAWWTGGKLIGQLRRRRLLGHDRELAAARVKAEADRRRAAEYARDQKLRTQNHEMQSALLELESAPDFQRAAWFASRAQDIPIAFRQHQFHRFRGCSSTW